MTTVVDYAEGGAAVPKIKLIRNAKYDPQFEVTVVPGYTAADYDALREEALRQDRLLTEALR